MKVSILGDVWTMNPELDVSEQFVDSQFHTQLSLVICIYKACFSSKYCFQIV